MEKLFQIKSNGDSFNKKKERYAVPKGGQINLYGNPFIKFARKKREKERERKKARKKRKERKKRKTKKERKTENLNGQKDETQKGKGK